MFDQTFVDTRAQTRRPWTVAASLGLQTILVAIAFLAPLLHVAILQKPDAVPVWLPPQILKRAAEPETKPVAARVPVANRPLFSFARLPTPTVVPKTIAIAADAPAIGNTAFGAPTGDSPVFGLASGVTVQPPQPGVATVKPQPPSQTTPIRVSGGVQSAKLVYSPKPSYPPLAKTARVQGMVRIQAIIDRDGAIRNLQVLSGPPLLIEVAKQAVQQWRYQPTTLNGEAVEVITEIDVNFTIAQ